MKPFTNRYQTITALLFLAFICSAPVLGAKIGLSKSLTPVADRPPAPDFVLADVDGKRHQLSSARGKVVLINFWATWCPPCREEMPSMQRAYEILKAEPFQMLAINVGESEEEIFAFTFEMGVELKFPMLLDSQGEIIKQWPVLGLPTSFVVDKQGRIAYRAVGGRDMASEGVLRQLRELMRE